MRFSPPLPNVGLGVRGRVHSWRSRKHSANLIQSRVSGIDSALRYFPLPPPPPTPQPCRKPNPSPRLGNLFRPEVPPPPPAPLPRWGEGNRCSRFLVVSHQLV